MPLDYHLSPDSPLNQPGVFERLTHRAGGHLKPIHSLMQADECLALLSFPGIVWFVSKHTGQEPTHAAVAVLSGMPWPLWNDGERQRLLRNVSETQAHLLEKVFRLRKGDLSIVLPFDKPSLPYWMHENPSGVPVLQDFVQRKNQADRGIAELARRTRQEENLIRQTILALRTYIECLDSGWLHRASPLPKYRVPELAALWCGIVVRHYTTLADYAEFSHLGLTSEQVPRLLRQVYVFYDCLWCEHLLPDRIRDTGAITERRSPEYIHAFRSAATDFFQHEHMSLIPTEGWHTFYQHDETQEDGDFYRRGKLENPCHGNDFAEFLSHLDIPGDRKPLALTAKLHFRTCQILDESHKLSQKEMGRWWKLQSNLAEKHIDEVLTKVIPVP